MMLCNFKKLHTSIATVAMLACSFLYAGKNGTAKRDPEEAHSPRKHPLPTLSIVIPENKNPCVQVPLTHQRQPQKQPGELYAIINPSWLSWALAWSRHVRKETMALVQSYNPQTQEFGTGQKAENDSLLHAAYTSFEDNHQPEMKQELVRLCQEKGIEIPASIQATIAATYVSPVPPTYTEEYVQPNSNQRQK
jgi:hypothetical protein